MHRDVPHHAQAPPEGQGPQRLNADPFQDDQPSRTSGSTVRAIGWGAYLACSWTWCIGMFLPILLIRDFGVLGWIVFAIPNAIGAAAMGWTMPGGRPLRDIIARHRAAIRLFSWVTIGFHLYWIAMLSGFRLDSEGVSGDPAFPWWAITVTAAAAVLFVGLMTRLPRWTPALSVLVWLVSASLAVVFTQQTGWPQLDVLMTDARPLAVLGLAPVVVFGFLCCPYLDATFIRARAENNARDARVAFGVGFGVLFVAMIVFTPVYGAIWTAGTSAAAWVLALIPAHLAMQAAFTMSTHGTTIPRSDASPARTALILAGAVAAVIAGLVVHALPALPESVGGMTAPEIGYRVFMAFYGLVFPAYVWIVMIGPDRRIGTGSLTPRALRVLVVSIALAAPFFGMGFLAQAEWWLAPGMIIVLAARWLRGPQPSLKGGSPDA